MDISINKEKLKKVSIIGINYQLIISILPILLVVIGTNILEEPLVMDINKNTFAAIAWTITIPPVIEELFFRKFLYTKFKDKFSARISMILSSLIFAVMHGNILLAIIAFGVGIISCKIYDRTKEIKYSMLLHSICNLFSAIFHNYITFNLYNGYFDLEILQFILITVLALSIILYKKCSLKLLENI